MVIAPVRQFQDSDPGVGQAAISSLGNFTSPAAIHALLPLLRDANPQITRLAASALDQCRWEPAAHPEYAGYHGLIRGRPEECIKVGPPALDVLLHALENVKSEGMIIPIHMSFGEIRDDRASRPIANIMKNNEQNWKICRACREALAMIDAE